MRRSALIVDVLGAALVFTASGSIGLRVGSGQLANLPENAPSVRGYEELSEEFPGGVLAPVNVLVQGALIPLQDFFQIATAVALGVLLDAFVIRALLVPALMLLVGPRGFWPSKVRS